MITRRKTADRAATAVRQKVSNEEGKVYVRSNWRKHDYTVIVELEKPANPDRIASLRAAFCSAVGHHPKYQEMQISVKPRISAPQNPQ